MVCASNVERKCVSFESKRKTTCTVIYKNTHTKPLYWYNAVNTRQQILCGHLWANQLSAYK